MAKRSRKRAEVVLTGEITREETMYVASFREITWGTHAPSLDQLLEDLSRMASAYLNAYEKKGRIEELMKLLGVDGNPDVLDFQFILFWPVGTVDSQIQVHSELPLYHAA